MKVIYTELKKAKIKKNIFHLILFLFIFHSIKSEIKECPRETPILISGECKLYYCSKEVLDTPDCKIANSTIKTQWLNNIIVFGDLNYRYINFASYESGDMVVETTCYPQSKKRMFFGLQENGRPFFTNNGENLFYSLNIQNDNNGNFEAVALIIKLTTEGREYFMSVSKLECNAEIVDYLDNSPKIYYKTTSSFTNINYVRTLRHAFIPLVSTNRHYFYLFGFIGSSDTSNTNNKIYFQKHKFGVRNFGSTLQSNSQPKENAYGNEVSCYQTNTNELIICFYLTKNITNNGHSQTTKVYFNLLKFKSDFTDEINLKFESSIVDETLFNKCIFLKDDAGVFVSYEKISNKYYPFILFKDYDIDQNNFTNFLPTETSKILIEKEGFNHTVLLNDIVKINDNKIAFSAPFDERKIVYIVIINIFGERQVKIRYYSIKLYALYHLKILSDLRIHRYKNYLSLAISYCSLEVCDNVEDEHYPGLMMFSYPNSTDVTIDFDTYLFENNVDPRNFKLDLTKYLTLENNIFGYILSNIYIVKIDGKHDKYLAYSSKDESVEIKENYYMAKDEKFIFKFT